jgi:hypothetical protein
MILLGYGTFRPPPGPSQGLIPAPSRFAFGQIAVTNPWVQGSSPWRPTSEIPYLIPSVGRKRGASRRP